MWKFQEELIVAIRDSEDGFLHLKRSRLLRETDSILSSAAAASGCGFNGNDVKVEALDPQLEAENYGVGSKWRWDWFRYNRYDPHFSENGGGAASGGADLKRLPRGQAEDEDEEEAEEVVAEMEKPCFGVGGDEHRNLEYEFGVSPTGPPMPDARVDITRSVSLRDVHAKFTSKAKLYAIAFLLSRTDIDENGPGE
ncbi:hypothetical protein Syun_016977 [Stephania yunnanensis]|uniref:Uncharacterized protein n=1 Tax=Stephania yunnanensis TaxID=152371 RepID=A0AAP0J705_9MAGN